jgi:apolipoprotein D and lipocalin family protein
MAKMKSKAFAILLLSALTGCVGNDALNNQTRIVPVENFEANRYLGKWYELGRIENSFERGMTKTTAHYSLNKDGTIKVINAGFDPAKGAYRSAIGKAKFATTPNVGALKVSFFGPFYGGYNVVALDKNYQWAIIVGPNPDKYFWILSRKPKLNSSLKSKALSVAKNMRINPSKIIWVSQNSAIN